MAFTALLSDLSSLYEEIGRHDQEHPWWGFHTDQLSPGEDETIRRILELALKEAERAEDSAIQIIQGFALDAPIELGSAHR